MAVQKFIAAMSTHDLLEKLVYSVTGAFCAGFTIGVLLILAVFILPTPDAVQNVPMPVLTICFLLAFLLFNIYLRRTLLPELKKRYRENKEDGS